MRRSDPRSSPMVLMPDCSRAAGATIAFGAVWLHRLIAASESAAESILVRFSVTVKSEPVSGRRKR